MGPTTYLLLPGAGGAGWLWHLVVDELRQRGEDAVAIDFEVGPGYGLAEYADAVVAAAGDRSDVTLVAQSMGGFTAALAAGRLPVSRIVFLNGMIPGPGETPGEWGESMGHAEAVRANDLADGRDTDPAFDLETYFTFELTAEQTDELLALEGEDAAEVFDTAAEFDGWPDVPLQAIAGRDDRFLPLEFQRKVARERLGVELVEVDGGHLAALSHPEQVADALVGGARAARRSETIGG
ncbi:alpha/beta fold hydrolase [Leifsonia sp. NPDC058230]|uniref:alpha/beta fold hydrolase n=1 Tax=Leifsonia sp. NPDC058230 TaxID=3346391 RepID=UPI0036DEE17E